MAAVVLAAAWVVESPEAQAQSAAGSPKLSQITPDKAMIQAYPKHYARFVLDTIGDGPSRVRIEAFWDGLYVVPMLNLSLQLGAGGKVPSMVPPFVADEYYVIPMKCTFRIVGRTFVEWEHEDTSIVSHNTIDSTWNQRVTATTATAPLGQSVVSKDAARWIGTYRGWVKGQAFDYTAWLRIIDRRKAQGGVRIVPSIGFSGPGLMPVRTVAHSVNKKEGSPVNGSFLVYLPLVTSLTVDPAAAEPQVVSKSMARLDFGALCDAAVMLTPDAFDLDALTLSHSGSVRGEPQRVTPHRQQIERWQKTDRAALLSDRTATARFAWSVGLKTEVDVTLEPMASDEALSLPQPNSVRRYKLKIKQPSLDKVQGLHVWLEGVSEHPGAATNVGQHCLWWGRCPHCTNCQKLVTAHRTIFTDRTVTPANRYTLNRYYHSYNACALDKKPDLFFRSTNSENPGWKQGDYATNEGLKYTISDELIRDEVDRDEYIISLAVEDSAASACLAADVMVNGAWRPVTCVGPTADALGQTLMYPLDQDGDGIGDAWRGVNSTPDFYADEDGSANTVHRGDGLTIFEEYRGVYTSDFTLARLSPDTHDLFVHDYTHMLEAGLDQTSGLYAAEGVALHRLSEGQFEGDVVNWSSDTQLGRQYQLVVMDAGIRPGGIPRSAWDAIWNRANGMASHVGPPQAEANTVFIGNPAGDDTMGGLLGHEMGHNINCSHHGNGNRWVTLTGDALGGVPLADGAYYVAVPGGQNSGHTACFMRYLIAHLACSDPNTPTPVKDHAALYQRYTWTGSHTCFCNDAQTSGIAFLGTASAGNCQKQISIRSYACQNVSR
jgi:hypothetical protein